MEDEGGTHQPPRPDRCRQILLCLEQTEGGAQLPRNFRRRGKCYFPRDPIGFSCSMTLRNFRLAGLVSILLALPTVLTGQDSWKATEEAAARAAKAAHFDEAEKLLTTNWRLAETLPAKDPRRPRTAFDLAEIYRAEGKYSQALPVYERALDIYTKLYGAEATEVADTLDGEAELYKSLNDYAHAEPLLLRCLTIRQKLLHPGDPDIAQAQNDLGEIYTATGAFDRAEPLLTQSLASRKRNPGPESADVAHSLEALGTLYSKSGRAQLAEDSYRQAVSIFGKTVGGDHPDYANALENLALCYGARRDFADAD